MLVTSYLHRFPSTSSAPPAGSPTGSLRSEETVVEGLDQAPAAFLGVLRGANTGKMLVRLGD